MLVYSKKTVFNPTTLMLKICTKCGIEKETSEFYKEKRKKDGLYSSCKECEKEYRHLPHVKAFKRKYNQSPKMKAWSAEYRKRPENIKRRHLWERGEKRKAYNASPEVIERKRKYRREHPEIYNKNDGNVSKKIFEKIKENFKWRCPECDECEPFFGQYWIWLVQDHIIPKSKGGAKNRKENIQPLCWDCNSKKRDLIFETNNPL